MARPFPLLRLRNTCALLHHIVENRIQPRVTSLEDVTNHYLFFHFCPVLWGRKFGSNLTVHWVDMVWCTCTCGGHCSSRHYLMCAHVCVLPLTFHVELLYIQPQKIDHILIVTHIGRDCRLSGCMWETVEGLQRVYYCTCECGSLCVNISPIPIPIPIPTGDCTLRVWDMHVPTPCVCAVPAHEADVLTCDWSKYNEVSMCGCTCTHPHRERVWEIRGELTNW